jgi:hypothetical protein
MMTEKAVVVGGESPAGSSYFHQQWPIYGGALTLELRTTRVLLGDEWTAVGKAVAEVEILAEMLGVGRKDFPPPEEAPPEE